MLVKSYNSSMSITSLMLYCMKIVSPLFYKKKSRCWRGFPNQHPLLTRLLLFSVTEKNSKHLHLRVTERWVTYLLHIRFYLSRDTNFSLNSCVNRHFCFGLMVLLTLDYLIWDMMGLYWKNCNTQIEHHLIDKCKRKQGW